MDHFLDELFTDREFLELAEASQPQFKPVNDYVSDAVAVSQLDKFDDQLMQKSITTSGDEVYTWLANQYQAYAWLDSIPLDTLQFCFKSLGALAARQRMLRLVYNIRMTTISTAATDTEVTVARQWMSSTVVDYMAVVSANPVIIGGCPVAASHSPRAAEAGPSQVAI